MFGLKTQCTLDFQEEYKTLEDYEGKLSRWCPGCGDNGIHSAALRLLRDEQLPPEKTVWRFSFRPVSDTTRIGDRCTS